MNLVSLLIAGAIVSMSVGQDQNDGLRIVIAIVAAGIIAGAVVMSKRRSTVIGDEPGTPADPPAAPPVAGHDPADPGHDTGHPTRGSDHDTAPTQQFEAPQSGQRPTH